LRANYGSRHIKIPNQLSCIIYSLGAKTFLSR
jgi:hypothetical protein